MIIFLYGPDDYRREEKKRWYIKEFEKKYSGLSVRTFDFADGSVSLAANGSNGILEEFRGFIRAQSLFPAPPGRDLAPSGESKKLAILENIYEADEEKLKDALREVVAKKATTSGEPIQRAQGGQSRTACGEQSRTACGEQSRTVILCSEQEKPAKALDFLIGKPATAERFEYLTGYGWEIFVRERAKKLGLKFSDFAFKFLAAVYQNNTWGLATELEKIKNLKSGIIDKKDLAGLDLEIAPDYWALLDGLRSGDFKTRMASLEKLFAIGDPPPKIFNILASGWREKIPQMAEYDLKVKSGKLDYEEALLDLAIS